MDNTAQIREEARKIGGDELVAKVDKMISGEQSYEASLQAMLDAALAMPEEGDERLFALVSLTEALSTAYARSAVAYGKQKNVPVSQIMVVAIRSVVGSIQSAVDDDQATENDVLSMIKKGFTPPKGDE